MINYNPNLYSNSLPDTFGNNIVLTGFPLSKSLNHIIQTPMKTIIPNIITFTGTKKKLKSILDYMVHDFIKYCFSVDTVKGIRKLSTIPLKLIQRLLHPRSEKMEKIYKQCTKSDNPDDLDTFIVNDLGFLELVHCVNKEKQEKAKKVHRY